MRVLVTGCYGFLGFSTARRLLAAGHEVLGIDKYKTAISEKADRVKLLANAAGFKFADINLANWSELRDYITKRHVDTVLHYAAQYSQPHSESHVRRCIEGNLVGYVNVMEVALAAKVKRVVYASSTFVQDGALPVYFYGACKDFNERCANVYSEQFGMETVGLRFGSVYGPYVRPDVGVSYVARHLFGGQPLDVGKGGFTYKVALVEVKDAVECAVRALTVPMKKKHTVASVVAEDETHDMHDVLTSLEDYTGLRAKRVGTYKPTVGFVPVEACAATRDALGFAPQTTLHKGLKDFVAWWKASR